MLIRTDFLGNHVWVKTFGGPNPDFGKYVRQVSGGSYVILRETFLSGNFDLFLARTDTGGNIIWAKTFGGSNNEYASSVQQTGDGGFVEVSNTQSFGAGQTYVLLIKTDGNGNLQWAKTYGGTLDDSARAIVQTSDGGYIITGTTNSFGTCTYNIFLIKTDSSGKDIVVVGYTRSFGADLHDFLLLKTDSLGNLQWVKTYGGSNEDWAYSVYETYDSGSTESFGAGLKDLPFPSTTDFRYGFCPRGLYPTLRRGISGLYGCENRYWGKCSYLPGGKSNTYGDLALYGGKCYKPHYHIFIFGK